MTVLATTIGYGGTPKKDMYYKAARADKEKKEMIFKLKRTHEKQEKAREIEQFYQNMIRAVPGC